MQCTTCAKTINNPKPKQITCIACQYEVRLQNLKKKKPPKREKVLRTCRCCAKEFWSEYKVEKFCSTECRNHKVNKSWLSKEAKPKKVRTPPQKKMVKQSFNKFPVFVPKEACAQV